MSTRSDAGSMWAGLCVIEMSEYLSRDLWELVYELLRHHQKPGKDASPNAVLNRLFREYIPQAKGVQLGEQNCEIRRESWTTQQLVDVRRRHSRADPVQEDCPVVLLQYAGEWCVIDGNNRVNRWVEQKDPGTHDVVIVDYRG